MKELPHTQVVIYDLGSISADLIRTLHSAGVAVCVVEPDQDDAERVHDILARMLPGWEPPISTTICDGCTVFVCRAGQASHAPAQSLIAVVDGAQCLEIVPEPDRTVAMDILDPRFVELALSNASEATREQALSFVDLMAVPYAISTRQDAFAGAILQDMALALVDRLLLVGITPWELDEALEQAGFTEGLLMAQDHIGLEVAFARRRISGADLLVADRMVREGRLGRSVGVGWYRYPGGGGAMIDPLMEDMITEEARFAGIDRVHMTNEQAAQALIVGMTNGAVHLLGDGLSKVDLDRLAFHKLGLPRLTDRAQKMGLDGMRKALTHLQKIDRELWAPSSALPLLY